MSLLLDALKKAADDKKKKTDDLSPDTTDDNNQDDIDALDISNDSLDLELHSSDESEDPQLDESALYDTEKVIAQSPEIDDNTTDELTTHTEDETDFEETPLEIDKNISSQTTLEQEQDLDTTSGTNTEPSSGSDNHKDNDNTEKADETENIHLQPISDSAKNIEHTINNEHALSELINKSNKHSQSQKRRQLIQLGILVALVLIGSGLYFYLQMSTATQDIYISQSNSSNIKRDSINRPTQTRPVITQEKSSSTDSPTVSNNQTASTKTPEPVKKSQTTSVKKQTTKNIKKPVISIVRTKQTDPIHDLLTAAYTAFNQSDYTRAEALYNKVLQREPKNRDALLGLSAIATKQQRYEVARQKYQLLLSLNPRDSIATAGLSSIKHLIDPQLNESKLKFMIKQQPDEAHLYFALGSLYSTQGKWPKAQSAYFSAWSAENKNADYAYNLAVSLDHLDKHKQALDFYQLSLKLSSHSNINFSTENTKHRINTLQGLGQ